MPRDDLAWVLGERRETAAKIASPRGVVPGLAHDVHALIFRGMVGLAPAEFDAQVACALDEYRRGIVDAAMLLERIEALAARAARPTEALARAAAAITRLPRQRPSRHSV